MQKKEYFGLPTSKLFELAQKIFFPIDKNACSVHLISEKVKKNSFDS